LCLEGTEMDLPLALSLEDRIIRPGKPGLALARRRPHLACLDFLPHLETGRTWSAGRHRLDAEAALLHVLELLARQLARSAGVALTLPGYLGEAQRVQVHRLAAAARLRLLGSLPAPLAAAHAATHGSQPVRLLDQPGLVLVIDVDGHALSWSVVERLADRLGVRLVQPSAPLGRGAWLRRLMDGVALRCIRQSRRDPRESADAEQALFEQLLRLLEEGPASSLAQLSVQGAGWYHHLMLHPDDLVGFTAPLLRQAVGELEAIVQTVEPLGELVGCVLTAAAAGLPGLAEAVKARLAPRWRADPADYGDMLVSGQGERFCLLPAAALACAAHEMAVRMHAGEVEPGHVEVLPRGARLAGPEVDIGPARLNFRGQDHLLRGSSFVLGRDPSCDLVFESELYPHVSGRHCEILFDRSAYTLHDRSRYGTLLNDRPVHKQAALHSGDWIRLGPQGPVVRFLGQPAASR
jgi:hypothetical protein